MSLKEFPENKGLFGDHKMFPRTPLREWIRKFIPSPKDGYVAEDLDLIFLRFGKAIGRNKDSDGQFILCEWKLKNQDLPYPQKRVFGLIDRLLRIGDPFGEFYQGFYYICWDGEDDTFIVNRQNITQKHFQMFLMGEYSISAYSFG